MLTRPRHLVLRLFPALLMAVSITACGTNVSLDEPIEGPLWRLTQVNDQPVEQGADAQREPHVSFDRSSGRVAGSGGCNRFGGTFTRSGSSLRIEQLSATKMGCADAARNSTESAFFAALQGTVSYRLAGPGRLALLSADGRTNALLQAAPGR